ncbi:MAG: hypothetical protein ACTSRZ_05990 [Promethearchaeota archaeon]
MKFINDPWVISSDLEDHEIPRSSNLSAEMRKNPYFLIFLGSNLYEK